MIKSYRCKDYQWAEVAANAAEINGGIVVSINRDNEGLNDQTGESCLRIWVRWPSGVPSDDPVMQRLMGHHTVD